MTKQSLAFGLLVSVFAILWFLGKPDEVESNSHFRRLGRPLSFTPVEPPLQQHLLIVFTMEDCPLCLFEAEYWALLPEVHGSRIDITGLTPDCDVERLHSFLDEYQIVFPIRSNEAEFKQVLEFLEAHNLPTTTPLKLFIDERGKLVAVERGTKSLEAQITLPDRVGELFGIPAGGR